MNDSVFSICSCEYPVLILLHHQEWCCLIKRCWPIKNSSVSWSPKVVLWRPFIHGELSCHRWMDGQTWSEKQCDGGTEGLESQDSVMEGQERRVKTRCVTTKMCFRKEENNSWRGWSVSGSSCNGVNTTCTSSFFNKMNKKGRNEAVRERRFGNDNQESGILPRNEFLHGLAAILGFKASVGISIQVGQKWMICWNFYGLLNSFSLKISCFH